MMTRQTATARQNVDAGHQGALFGDPTPGPAPGRSGHDGTAVQDPELVAEVVRTADGAGFLLIERTQRVVKADPATPGVVDSAARHEQDAVLQLLDTGHLRTGGTHHVHHHGHEGPARSILVPKGTRDMVTRWSHLRPVPTSRPARDDHRTNTGAAAEPVSGPITVTVLAPGRGHVACDEFRGEITREDGRYIVTTERGHRVARTSSYHLGARRLARHHGYRPGPVEISHHDPEGTR